MVAARRNGGPGAQSWGYSNADSFSDDMYSSLTFYNRAPLYPSPLYESAPRSSSQPHYVTAPRNKTKVKPNNFGPEAPPPYAAMEMLMEDYHNGPEDTDSGYDSGVTTPEPHNICFPEPQPEVSQQTNTIQTRRKADYYWIMRAVTADQRATFEHGLGSDLTAPTICFVCGMEPTPKKPKNRNNDVSKPDADPLQYIRDNCEHAMRALSSHRKLHNCDCDFAYLDGRKRDTANCWRHNSDGEPVPVQFGPKQPCRKRWFTGFFVRQHMAFHDRYCGCRCFGQKEKHTAAKHD